jgi:hypothetical protein
MLPILYIFFISKCLNRIDNRRIYFHDLLDKNEKKGIYKCFLKAGLDETKTN